jgi:hypothetical protein
MIMGIRKNMAAAAALCLSSAVYELEATPWAELRDRFAEYGIQFSGKLGKQIRTVRLELDYCARVEARDPWGFFAEKMLSLYPFFAELATNPVKVYLQREVAWDMPVFTKSHWRHERCEMLLGRFGKIRNLAEAPGTRPSAGLQKLLQEATDFVRAVYDENLRIHREEEEELERQRAEFDFEKCMAAMPEEFREVFLYSLHPERSTLVPHELDQGELLETQIRIQEWQARQPLVPYLPDAADREEFLKTQKRILAEAVADL